MHTQRLEWEQVGEREPQEYPPEYFIVGQFNGWGGDGYVPILAKIYSGLIA